MLLLQIAAPPPMPWYFMVVFAAIALFLIATGIRDLRAGTTSEGARRAAARRLRGEEAKTYTGGMARLISGTRVLVGVALIGFVVYQLVR